MARRRTKTKKSGCLVAILGVLFLFGLFGGDDPTPKTTTTRPTVAATATATVSATSAPIVTARPSAVSTISEDSSFEIHYLDVGQGDASLVLCDGKAMLIDGGESSESSFIYAYLKEHGITHLDYIIASHGHSDHVGGLSGALNYATVGKALCSVENYDTEEFADFIKYLDKQGVQITVPAVGDVFTLGSATFEILAPRSDSSNHNNMSLVLRVVYGDTSFLFTGDAEEGEENELNSLTLRSDVLKVAHHGSGNSTSSSFLKKVRPMFAIISAGEDNAYSFPSQDTLDRLRSSNVKVYRTDLQGTIICKSDGENFITFTTSKNEDADTLIRATATPTPTAKPIPAATAKATAKPTQKPANVKTYTYVLNKNTKKFHYPSCGSVKQMKDKNKGSFTGTREEVIRKGYSPCGNCKP